MKATRSSEMSVEFHLTTLHYMYVVHGDYIQRLGLVTIKYIKVMYPIAIRS
jgi:hypothetical protein